jgi:hypothetical protein
MENIIYNLFLQSLDYLDEKNKNKKYLSDYYYNNNYNKQELLTTFDKMSNDRLLGIEARTKQEANFLLQLTRLIIDKDVNFFINMFQNQDTLDAESDDEEDDLMENVEDDLGYRLALELGLDINENRENKENTENVKQDITTMKPEEFYIYISNMQKYFFHTTTEILNNEEVKVSDWKPYIFNTDNLRTELVKLINQ